MCFMSDYLDPNNEELLNDFFAEATQQVDQLESNILVIENDPANHDAIDEIFRAAHTLKGGSATVEMTELTNFTHSVEDLLDEIRSDNVKVNEDIVDLLLNSIDVIKAMLESRQNGSVYEENVDGILERLHSYVPGKGDAKKSAAKQEKPPVQPVAVEKVTETPSGMDMPGLSESEFIELKGECGANQKLWCVGVNFDEENPMNSVGGIQVFAALKSSGNVLKTVPDFDALYEDNFYEYVFYFVASESEGSALEEAAYISDVTLATDARLITDDNYAGGLPKAASSSKEEDVVSEKEVQKTVETKTEVQEVKTEATSEKEKTSESQVVKTENKKPETKKSDHAQQGSVLRVESKRIDNLLNLVSEAVIVKASFNQLAAQTVQENSIFQQLEGQLKERIQQLFAQIPQYLDQVQSGERTINEVRKTMTNEFGDMGTMFDSYESEMKSITTKFRSYTQNLGSIAGELQEGVMKIRMVPINQIFSRFPRVVRDLQRDLGKKINLVIEGEDTELDKSVVEDLLDPIMHCVRNSVDHGIEMPDVRAKAGKDETGTVLLKASNEGNQIVIEIKDDGAGIDVEKVKRKAVEKGLIHPDKIISDQDAYQLIMQPGFSTADKISNISGRGVGLDVVRTMINNLKGTISVNSEKGKGTSFIIRIPLTLAIIQGLLVRVGKEIYSIPIANVVESQCIKLDEINHIDNYEIMNVRNEVISVLRLSRLFNIKETNQSDECYIVIVGSQEKKIGVMVDALIGEEDVVIKPLKDQFTNSPGIAGASILGDGSVSLIIDVSQLLELGVRQEIIAQQNAQYA